MRRVLAVLFVSALAVTGMIAIAPTAQAAGSEEAGFVSRINGLRQSKGLNALTVDGNLTSIGRNWSQKMLSAGSISHNSSFSSQVTSSWSKLGENVGHGGSVDSLFQAFVNSPGHYRNLVDPAFTHIGVGVVTGPDGTLWTSHQFMTLKGSSARAAAPTAPAATASATGTVSRTSTTTRTKTTTARRASAPAAAPTPPPPPPVPPIRIVMSLDQLRSLSPSS